MKIGNFVVDREGRKALLLIIGLIVLVAVIAKEMHKAKMEEAQFLEISGFIGSLVKEDKPEQSFEFKNKTISVTPIPKLEANTYRYTVSGIDRHKECSIILNELGRNLRNDDSSATIRISQGELYPAVISKDWSSVEIDRFIVSACEIVHRNKTQILIDIN